MADDTDVTDCHRVPRAKISRASIVMRRIGDVVKRMEFGVEVAGEKRGVSMALFYPENSRKNMGCYADFFRPNESHRSIATTVSGECPAQSKRRIKDLSVGLCPIEKCPSGEYA